MTTDQTSATDFYNKVIGWGTQPWEGGEMPYTMWTNKEKTIGGLMDLPEEAKQAGAPPHWLTYISTPDTDATVARAKQLGAQAYVEPQDIPNVGKFAVLADPQGATFAVFTPLEDTPGSDDPPGQGEFSWHELATSNYEAAWDFYADLFGWEKTEAMDMGEGSIYQMYGRGGTPLGGMFNKPAEMPGPPAWLFYAHVDDVNTTAEKVKANGGQVVVGPMEVPGGDLIAQCLDPQGAFFAIHSTAKG
jgi:predicted enzyme related to lactoylglutathione lyase